MLRPLIYTSVEIWLGMRILIIIQPPSVFLIFLMKFCNEDYFYKFVQWAI